jgi:hypothetical protein
MLKWCQLRVFFLTCAGVLAGNILARAIHVAPAFIVVPMGIAGWLAGNALNAAIARRSAVACESIELPNLLQRDSHGRTALNSGEIPLEELS